VEIYDFSGSALLGELDLTRQALNQPDVTLRRVCCYASEITSFLLKALSKRSPFSLPLNTSTERS
jgi:hypothetical protein